MYVKSYFQWQNDNYGAFYRDSIILLRTNLNYYYGIEEEASFYLKIILTNGFDKINNEFNLVLAEVNHKRLNDYIEYFVRQGLIEETNELDRSNVIAEPLEPIGLQEKEWYSKSRNVQTNTWLTIKAFCILHTIHQILKKKQMQGIINYLNKVANKSNKELRNLSKQESLKLAKALDNACLFYPTKTLCLPFAAALASLHFTQGYACNFLIGIQNLPFYAHAWVEADGEVINDNPELQTKLAPILKITPNLQTI